MGKKANCQVAVSLHRTEASGSSPLGFRLYLPEVWTEDRARSSWRRQQMGELLQQVRSLSGPLVIGGDLNTSGTDGAPTSISYEIKKRVADPHFWVKQGIQWFTPLAIPFYIA